ncbi:MAG: STAS domain-containing protein [Gaiellaceae bacterium]|jgi:anti-sigma B factor antagonist|nr:STAS domain-containing protein [Acidobacteriota bacterium]
MSVLELRVASSQIGASTHVVAVTGELDLYSAEQLQRALAELIDKGAQGVVLDLMGVSFIDSAGLSVLISAAKAIRSLGGRLIVAADDRRILRLLQITGLERSIHVERSLVEAVENVVDSRLAG